MIDNGNVGHYTGYNLIGRTEVEPFPVNPDFKKTGRFWLFALTRCSRHRMRAARESFASVTPMQNAATTVGTGIPAAAACVA